MEAMETVFWKSSKLECYFLMTMELYFSAGHSWESCLMHGGDRKRKASFVIQIRFGPLGADVAFTETPGILDTLELRMVKSMPVEVLEMYPAAYLMVRL